MAMSQAEYGLYIPTTNVWDVAALQQMDVNSAEFKELLIRLYQNLNNIATVLNLKDSAYYNTLEFVNGQMWFPNPANNSSTVGTATFRNDYRMVVNFGALPKAGTTSIAHNIPINGAYTFTRIYGAASDTTTLTYIPIPFVSATSVVDQLQLDIDSTYVNITTGGKDYSGYNVCYVVLEYLKN